MLGITQYISTTKLFILLFITSGAISYVVTPLVIKLAKKNWSD